jgi:CMP-N-acetylneuraminic acid synthetase
MMRVLAVIPARGGSKGIPRKNIRLLGGKPLLAWTAEAALRSKRISRAVLSTEDREIAEVGKRSGLDVPTQRPADLALDSTPTLPVVQYVVAELESLGDCFDAVCLLQPTTPFREPEQIDAAVLLLEETGADSVVSVRRVPAEFNPHWVYVQAENGFLQLSTGEASPIPRRQDLPTVWHRDGSIYIVRRDVLMQKNSLYGSSTAGFETTGPTVNLDTPEDWVRAEELLATAVL